MENEDSTHNDTVPKAEANKRKPLTGQAWIDAFEEFKREVEARDHLYPEGYEVKCDRASIYGYDEDESE